MLLLVVLASARGSFRAVCLPSGNWGSSPLTEDTLRQICGVNTTFQRISCGYGIIPSKIYKAFEANQNIQDWGAAEYYKKEVLKGIISIGGDKVRYFF